MTQDYLLYVTISTNICNKSKTVSDQTALVENLNSYLSHFLSHFFVQLIYNCIIYIAINNIHTMYIIHRSVIFKYPTKNAPIPTKKSYLVKKIEVIELVIKRMRQEAIFHNVQKG